MSYEHVAGVQTFKCVLRSAPSTRQNAGPAFAICPVGRSAVEVQHQGEVRVEAPRRCVTTMMEERHVTGNADGFAVHINHGRSPLERGLKQYGVRERHDGILVAVRVENIRRDKASLVEQVDVVGVVDAKCFVPPREPSPHPVWPVLCEAVINHPARHGRSLDSERPKSHVPRRRIRDRGGTQTLAPQKDLVPCIIEPLFQPLCGHEYVHRLVPAW
mmetsp:Transcript_53046/g.147672  ORF Transcript_53046/g.147672 Transcript_53046/m.147672 type:complete len:216 (-) Transcript_53046:112-759(-)